MIPPIDNTKDKKSLTMNDKPESSSVKKYKTCKNSSYTVHLKMTHTDTTRDGGAVTLTCKHVNPGEKGAGGLGGARDKGLRGPRSRGRRW